MCVLSPGIWSVVPSPDIRTLGGKIFLAEDGLSKWVVIQASPLCGGDFAILDTLRQIFGLEVRNLSGSRHLTSMGLSGVLV